MRCFGTVLQAEPKKRDIIVPWAIFDMNPLEAGAFSD